MPHPARVPPTTTAKAVLAVRARMAAAESRNIAANRITRARASETASPSRTGPAMTTESAFIAAADGTLAAIGDALDRALDASDADAGWGLNDGILEIECEDRSKLIVNRHVPNREIWVAARSGGFHFGARDGRWRDTRTGATLDAALGELLLAQAGLAIELPLLPAPAGR